MMYVEYEMLASDPGLSDDSLRRPLSQLQYDIRKISALAQEPVVISVCFANP